MTTIGNKTGLKLDAHNADAFGRLSFTTNLTKQKNSYALIAIKKIIFRSVMIFFGFGFVNEIS
jgi:hypothetical protein